MVRRSGISEATLRDSKLIADGGFTPLPFPTYGARSELTKISESRVHKRLHTHRPLPMEHRNCLLGSEKFRGLAASL